MKSMMRGFWYFSVLVAECGKGSFWNFAMHIMFRLTLWRRHSGVVAQLSEAARMERQSVSIVQIGAIWDVCGSTAASMPSLESRWSRDSCQGIKKKGEL